MLTHPHPHTTANPIANHLPDAKPAALRPTGTGASTASTAPSAHGAGPSAHGAGLSAGGADAPVRSADILRGHKTVDIAHNGMLYTLQATKLGKLILTK